MKITHAPTAARGAKAQPKVRRLCGEFRSHPLGATGVLTIAEVSELLDFHDVTLRDWAREGLLPAMRIAGLWRFDPADLAAWVEARRVG